MTRRRTLRGVALGTGAVLCAAVGGSSSAGDERAPPEDVLRIASDEPLVVRFARPVPKSRVGSQSFRVERERDGEPAKGRYVAGGFLVDPAIGNAVVVDPEGFTQIVQVARKLDRDAAVALVEDALSSCERTGRVDELRWLHSSVRDARSSVGLGDYSYDPWLSGPINGGQPRSLPQQDAAASDGLRALRKLQAGDDALWERYISGEDPDAFAALSADPLNARFHHSTDPVTGSPFAESDYQRRENRRVLFAGARSRRVFTFVPEVPTTPGLEGISYTSNDRYLVTLAPGLPASIGGIADGAGFRAAVRHRTAVLETTYPDRTYPSLLGTTLLHPAFALSELPNEALELADVTPPLGERLVDPSTDWENPSDRFSVPAWQRSPFVIRLRSNMPVDPSRAADGLYLEQTRAFVGTANERLVNAHVPADVRVRQSRLGDVVVEIRPKLTLDPSAQFRVSSKPSFTSLAGHFSWTGFRASFTTAPLEQRREVVDSEFLKLEFWGEADTSSPRPLQLAAATHDPSGTGRFVPFLGDDPEPVRTLESVWFDSHAIRPRYVVEFDDPATPESEGTSLHAPPGAGVRLFLRTAAGNAGADGPDLSLRGPWVEVDPELPGGLGQGLGEQFVQARIEFTLPPGAGPETADLPYVDRVKIVARFD